MVLTSCCTWQVNSVTWLVASLQIQDSNNADVLLDSGLNLFDIIVNLCSKLHYKCYRSQEIILCIYWSGLLLLDFNKRGCAKQIWVGSSSLLILPTHALNYCIQKWEKHLEGRLFMFSTWIVRWHNPVWVHKLTDIVTNIWLGIGKWYKESFKCDTCIWNH